MAKRRSRTVPELEAENRFLRKRGRAEAVTSVINNVIRWGGLVWVASYAYRAVEALAGQRTVADLGLRFLTDVRVSTLAAWLVGASAVMYGWRQRGLRRSAIERMSSRIQELERQFDHKRSSSRLTPRGDTHPRDSYE